jgi:plasmid stability protein
MKDDVHKALKIFASTHNRSVNEIVNEAFSVWWQSHPSRPEFERLAKRAARTVKPGGEDGEGR